MNNAQKNEVVKILIEDEALVGIEGNWERLYSALINKEFGTKSQLRAAYNQKTTTDYNLFSEILTKWISQKGKLATIEELIKILRDLEFGIAADKLNEKFGAASPPEPSVIPRKPFPMAKVANVLKEDTYLILNWQLVYDFLDIQDNGTKVNLDKSCKDKSINHYDLFSTILTTWIAQKGFLATVPALVKVLRDAKCVTAAEKLEAETF